MTTVYKNLLLIQQELKAPKGQYNSFGKYHYRSCEDILEAVKPIAHKHGCVVTVTDDIDKIGERYYVRAIAILTDVETGEQVQNVAYAREEEEKKGMDESQITGAASSYARKYALNGLFAIDDTKDADTDEHKKQSDGNKQANKANKPPTQPCNIADDSKPSEAQIKRLFAIASKSDKTKGQPADVFLHAVIKQKWQIQSLNDLTKAEYDSLCKWLEGDK